jgi:hypothetical protein
MLQRLFGILLGAVMALPAYAQDAGPLALDAGMRAYTTRVFVEPEVLAELSVGDEVSFYVTYFTSWDFESAEGFEDTYVVESVVQYLKVLAFEQVLIDRTKAPLLQTMIRVEGIDTDIQKLALSDFAQMDGSNRGVYLPREVYRAAPFGLTASGVVVMVQSAGELPVFCEVCETMSFGDFVLLQQENEGRCYRTIRRGVEVTRTEVPCPDD